MPLRQVEKDHRVDQFTEDHLDMWLVRQFPHERDYDLCLIRERMLDTYESDPEHYDGAGWWRCYNDTQNNPPPLR